MVMDKGGNTSHPLFHFLVVDGIALLPDYFQIFEQIFFRDQGVGVT